MEGMTSRVHLSLYNNDSYHPGRSGFWQIGWFLLGLPVLRSAVVPFSGARVRLLRMFGARIGDGVVIKPGVRVKYPWRLTIGDDCWIGEDCWIDNVADVGIGADVCLSQSSYLCTGNHDWTDPAFALTAREIVIEDGAWIGAKAIVCPGVSVREGAVVGAGAVAKRSVPAFEIHAGNPAEFVRYRQLRDDAAGEPEPVCAGLAGRK
jgi:putative colanic acid biosynthesis acetyltransferase WcaF